MDFAFMAGASAPAPTPELERDKNAEEEAARLAQEEADDAFYAAQEAAVDAQLSQLQSTAAEPQVAALIRYLGALKNHFGARKSGAEANAAATAEVAAAQEGMQKAKDDIVSEAMKSTGQHFYNLKVVPEADDPTIFMYGMPLEAFIRVGFEGHMWRIGEDDSVRPIAVGKRCEMHVFCGDDSDDEDAYQFIPSFVVEQAVEKREVYDVQASDRAALVALADHFPQLKSSPHWCAEGVPLGVWGNVKLSSEGRVEQLLLGDLGLSGSVPCDVLRQLTRLKTLELFTHGNSFTELPILIRGTDGYLSAYSSVADIPGAAEYSYVLTAKTSFLDEELGVDVDLCLREGWPGFAGPGMLRIKGGDDGERPLRAGTEIEYTAQHWSSWKTFRTIKEANGFVAAKASAPPPAANAPPAPPASAAGGGATVTMGVCCVPLCEGEYDVVFTGPRLGMGLLAADLPHELPVVSAAPADQPLPNVNHKIVAVNGYQLAGSPDTYSKAVEIISTAGRPVTITFRV